MTFSRYVCWRPERVRIVMNPDAEQVEDEVFLAVHSEHPLTLLDTDPTIRQWATRRRSQMQPRDFLREFLSPTRPHVQVAVVGGSGSGKSHLIHWMQLNMPDRDDLYVLAIPKTGTTLRGVLDRIIGVLPQDAQQRYRDRLDQAGYHSESHVQRKHRLLSMIALAVRQDGPSSSDGVDPDAEKWLLDGLPYVFDDTHLRQYFNRKGGIVDDLVAHIAATRHTYQRAEERRAFSPEDLPLSGVDVAQMAGPTRAFLAELMANRGYVPLAVQIINRNLNRAIAQVLNFSGDDLIALMADIRRYLRVQGKELVLLIEDFARLQGMDMALLQALIESAGRNNELCRLRWAMAVTSGYYEQTAATVQTRMDFIVDMDLPTRGTEAVLAEDDLVSFAARYLNAGRLTAEELRDWYATGETGRSRHPVPNACDRCDFREQCHATFRTAEGFGLYPFTRGALLNMAELQDPDIGERFNPRRLIKFVLAEVLDVHREDLEASRFPSDALREYMGSSRLPPAVQDQLQQRNPEQFARQRAVLELWGDPPRVVELPDGLYTAFNVPVPRLDGLVVAGPQPAPEPGPGPRPPTILDRRIGQVRAWGNGERMPQDLAEYLRDPIYQALESYLDWDAAGLERATFARRGGGAPFRARNIAFANQTTQAPTGIVLNVPTEPSDAEELRLSAIALEGLVQYQQHRHWRFAGGQQALVALAECLPRWGAAVQEQILRLPDAQGGWDPVGSAVEVLAIGAVLGGRLPASNSAPKATDLLNALFDAWPDEAPVQSSEWKQLYRRIRDRRTELQGIVTAWATGPKGGQAGAFLNPTKVLPPLRKLARSWTPSALPPEEASGRRDEYGGLARLHAELRESLPRAAHAELQRKRAWLAEVRRRIPEGTRRLDVVGALLDVRNAVTTHALPCRQPVLRQFDEALEPFRRVHLDNALEAVERLRDVRDALDALPQLARDRTQAVAAADSFLPAAALLLDEVESALTVKRMSVVETVGEGLQRDRERVKTSLTVLDQVLGQMGEGA